MTQCQIKRHVGTDCVNDAEPGRNACKSCRIWTVRQMHSALYRYGQWEFSAELERVAVVEYKGADYAK